MTKIVELTAVSCGYAYVYRIYNAGEGFLPSTVSPNLFVECIPVSQCQECEDREGTLIERKKVNFSSHQNPGFQQTKTTNPWPFLVAQMIGKRLSGPRSKVQSISGPTGTKGLF